jgi:hypothetical protein
MTPRPPLPMLKTLRCISYCSDHPGNMGDSGSESWHRQNFVHVETDSDMTPASGTGNTGTTVRSLGHVSLGHLQSLLAMISFQTNMWFTAYLRSARTRNSVGIQRSGIMIQPNNTGAPHIAVPNVSISVLHCTFGAAHALYGRAVLHDTHPPTRNQILGWCCVGSGKSI